MQEQQELEQEQQELEQEQQELEQIQKLDLSEQINQKINQKINHAYYKNQSKKEKIAEIDNQPKKSIISNIYFVILAIFGAFLGLFLWKKRKRAETERKSNANSMSNSSEQKNELEFANFGFWLNA